MRRRGFTLIELLVVVLILAVLTAVAIPLYFKSVDDSETYGCKTNMSSIAAAVQAQRVRTGQAYFVGSVDDASTAETAALSDLHYAVPHCPGDSSAYQVSSDSNGGFIIRCSNPRHRFQWHNGKWETY